MAPETQTRAIIGYPTPYNIELLKRLHQESLPLPQGILVAVYLVAQSKKFDDGVGGETSIAVVTPTSVWIEAPHYVSQAEARIKRFMQLTDELFLRCADTELSMDELRAILEQFGEKALRLHREQIVEMVREMFSHGLNIGGDGLAHIPPGTVVTFGGGFRVYDPSEIPDRSTPSLDAPAPSSDEQKDKE